jgi:hypothetical protein
MSLRNIINAALSLAQSVANSGKVYPHIVWSVDDSDVQSLFTDGSNRLNTIMITRESTNSIDRGPNDNRDQHTLVFEWFRVSHRAADDSINVEDGFQDDVEAMRTAFKNNRKLTTGVDPNKVRNAIFCDPMIARVVDYRMFKGLLCNHATLALVAEDGPFNTTSV